MSKSILGIALFPLLLFLAGCAPFLPPSLPSPAEGGLKMGQSKAQIDRYFSGQNNATGHWAVKTLDIHVENGRLTTVNLYQWKAAPWHHVKERVRAYEMVFIGGELASYQIVEPKKKPNIPAEGTVSQPGPGSEGLINRCGRARATENPYETRDNWVFCP